MGRNFSNVEKDVTIKVCIGVRDWDAKTAKELNINFVVVIKKEEHN